MYKGSHRWYTGGHADGHGHPRPYAQAKHPNAARLLHVHSTIRWEPSMPRARHPVSHPISSGSHALMSEVEALHRCLLPGIPSLTRSRSQMAQEAKVSVQVCRSSGAMQRPSHVPSDSQPPRSTLNTAVTKLSWDASPGVEKPGRKGAMVKPADSTCI